MGMVLITPPTVDVVSRADAKKQLRITGTDYDALIDALIASAVAQLDPAGGGWLGLALRPQTWELRLDGFPYGYCGSGFSRNFRAYNEIVLPYPPLISLDSVKYYNSDGVDTTLVANTDYRVMGGGNEKSYVVPTYNGTWPSSVRSDLESVRVRYTAGHQLTNPDSLPPPIKQAVLLAVRDLWSLGERNLYLRAESAPGLASYEWTVSENAGVVIRAACENMLSTYRVYD